MSIKSFLAQHLLTGEKLVAYFRKQGVTIGMDCELYGTVHFGSEPYLVTLGNHVRVTHGVCFITHDGGYWVLRCKNTEYYEKFKYADHIMPIVVKDNVHIGINAIIMPGVTIGENSVIGCGAVVTHDIPPNSIAGGVPARIIESTEEYARKSEPRAIRTKHMSRKEKRRFLTEKLKSDNGNQRSKQ